MKSAGLSCLFFTWVELASQERHSVSPRVVDYQFSCAALCAIACAIREPGDRHDRFTFYNAPIEEENAITGGARSSEDRWRLHQSSGGNRIKDVTQNHKWSTKGFDRGGG